MFFGLACVIVQGCSSLSHSDQRLLLGGCIIIIIITIIIIMHVSSIHDASTTLLTITYAFLFLVDVGLIKATIVIKQIVIMIMYGIRLY